MLDQASSNRLQQAAALATTGQREEAAKVCRDVLTSEPDHLPALLWLGYSSPNQVESENSIAKAYEINPQHPGVLKAVEWYNTHFIDPQSGPAAAEKAPTDRMQQPLGEPVRDHANFFMSQTGGMLIGSAAIMLFSGSLFLIYSGLLFRSQIWTPFALRREIYAVGGFIMFWVALAFVVFAVMDVITPPIRATGFISERKEIRREVRERYGTSIEYHFELKFMPDDAADTGKSFIILKLTEDQYKASAQSNRAKVIYSRRLGNCRVYQAMRSVY